jgi:5-formyltetrahydrofolate cyclo-ligase
MLVAMEDKAQIRKRLLSRRQQISSNERAVACGYLCDKLLTITLPEASAIAGYSAINGEVDIAQALNHYYTRNHPVFLPVVAKPETILQFLKWSPESAMRTGAYGIAEPLGGEVGVPDVIWVPLVAFDRTGHRLGYGAGYYDMTVAHLRKGNPKLLAIGIGYAFQEVDKLPAEAHDAKLDMIVTEKEIIRL